MVGGEAESKFDWEKRNENIKLKKRDRETKKKEKKKAFVNSSRHMWRDAIHGWMLHEGLHKLMDGFFGVFIRHFG